MAKEGKKALAPKLRFPEFRGSAEWKAERMDLLYSFMRNNTLSREKLNYEAGTAKNIHYGDIHTKFSTLFDITKERVPYINVNEGLPDIDSDDYCVEGDLVFADSSEDMSDVGKCIEIVRLENQLLLAATYDSRAPKEWRARYRFWRPRFSVGTSPFANPTRSSGYEGLCDLTNAIGAD